MVSAISLLAYQEVGDFELLIRRLIRWQLRGRYGRSWLVELEALAETIDDNRGREVARGFQDRVSSELSYLSLSDLFTILAAGKHGFVPILGSRVPRSEQNGVASVRNRVAHFRGIGSNEMDAIRKLSWIRDALKVHFLTRISVATLPDPASAEETAGATADFVARMAELGHTPVLDSYSEIEQTGREGFVTRFGIYDHHLFLEGYCESGFFDPIAFMDWINDVRDRVTLLKFGARGQFVRIFISRIYSSKEVSKVFRTGVSLMRQGVRSGGEVSRKLQDTLDEIESDYVAVELEQKSISFAL